MFFLLLIFNLIARVHLYEPITEFTNIAKAKVRVNQINSKTLQNNYVATVDSKKIQPEHEKEEKEKSSENEEELKSADTLIKIEKEMPEKVEKLTAKSGRERSMTSPVLPREKRRVLQIESKPILSTLLKTEVAKIGFKERPFFQEVAEVFEEILEAIEEGKTSLPKREKGGHITNKVRDEKNKLKEQEDKDKEELDKKRKLRHQIVKHQLKEYKEKHVKETKKKEEQVKKSEQEITDKKKEEKRKQMADKLREKAKEFSQKKKGVEEQKKKEKEEKKDAQKDGKKKAFESFNNERVAKLVIERND